MTDAPVRREIRSLLKLALPLIAGQVLLFGANVVDTLLAGHLGAEVLGAVAIGGSLWMLPLMTMQGILFAVPPSVAQLDGAGRRAEVGQVFRQALYLAVMLGLVMLLAIRLLGGAAIGLIGLPASLVPDVRGFLDGVSLGAPALAVFMACRGLSDGLSLTKPAMWFGLLGLMLLAPIGYGFMYGVAGLPGMGHAAAGWRPRWSSGSRRCAS